MTGFVFEGSTDPSLEYDTPLTETPVLGTDRGTPTYSSTGVVCGSDDGVDIDLTSLSLPASIETSGQYTIFVESQYCAFQDTAFGSFGITQSLVTNYLISHNDTGLFQSPFSRSSFGNTGEFSPKLNNADGNQLVRSHSVIGGGLMEKVPLSFVWDSGLYDIYLNFVKIVSGKAFTTFTDMFSFIFLFTNLGATGGTFMGPSARYSLASATATFPSLGTVLAVGDSFIAQAAETNTGVGSPRYTATTINIFQGMTRKRQNAEYTFVVSGVGSEKVADTLARIDALLSANNPIIVYIHTATNDAANLPLSASFEADFLDLITRCAVFASVQKVVYESIPTVSANPATDTAAFVANTAAVNAKMTTAVATLGSSKVIESDLFSAMGGESPLRGTPTALFVGFQNDTANLHPSAYGENTRAELFYNAVNIPGLGPSKGLISGLIG